jgi:hypothetical protein
MGRFDKNGNWTWDESEFAPKPLSRSEIKLLTGMDLDLSKPEDKAKYDAYVAKSGKQLELIEKAEWGAAGVGIALIVGFWVTMFAWVFSMAG